MTVPRIDGAHRDVLADGSDVTRDETRALIIRVVNWQIDFDHKFGGIVAELADNGRRLRELEARTTSMRPKLESIPEQVEVAAKRVIDKRELTLYRWLGGLGVAAALAEVAHWLFLAHHSP